MNAMRSFCPDSLDYVMLSPKRFDNLPPDRVDAQNHRGLDTLRFSFKKLKASKPLLSIHRVRGKT